MAIGHWQLLILAVIVLIFFVGPKKLPDLGKSLGKSIRDFKKALNEDDTLDVTNSAKAEKLEENSSSTTAKQKESEKENS